MNTFIIYPHVILNLNEFLLNVKQDILKNAGNHSAVIPKNASYVVFGRELGCATCL